VTDFVTRRRCDLLCEVGSGAHGLAIEGTNDHDEMGILCEPKSYVIGLQKWETTVRRTQADGTSIPDSVRSGPGDTDLTIHSMRKWVSLALNGNPTIITMLYAPTIFRTEIGEVLRDSGHLLLSRRALSAYLGYLTQQKERLLGTRGQKRTKRPELVEAHGFDTKYACHALRLGWQGIELAQLGRLELPMPYPQREFLRGLRRGEVSFDDAMNKITSAEITLERFKVGRLATVLPAEPDFKWANDFLVWAYEARWEQDASDQDEFGK
jgi:hypothetical protein